MQHWKTRRFHRDGKEGGFGANATGIESIDAALQLFDMCRPAESGATIALEQLAQVLKQHVGETHDVDKVLRPLRSETGQTSMGDGRVDFLSYWQCMDSFFREISGGTERLSEAALSQETDAIRGMRRFRDGVLELWRKGNPKDVIPSLALTTLLSEIRDASDEPSYWEEVMQAVPCDTNQGLALVEVAEAVCDFLRHVVTEEEEDDEDSDEDDDDLPEAASPPSKITSFEASKDRGDQSPRFSLKSELRQADSAYSTVTPPVSPQVPFGRSSTFAIGDRSAARHRDSLGVGPASEILRAQELVELIRRAVDESGDVPSQRAMQKLNLAHDAIARQLHQQDLELVELRRSNETAEKRMKRMEEGKHPLFTERTWDVVAGPCSLAMAAMAYAMQPKVAARAEPRSCRPSDVGVRPPAAPSVHLQGGRAGLAGGLLSCSLVPLAMARARNRRVPRKAEGLPALAQQIRQAFFKTEKRLKVLPDLLSTLQDVYQTKLQPLEEHLQFQRFYDTAELSAAYFTAKPMVLVLGQYSTGKSTLISQLLQADYPGLRVGPEPTTDKFVAIMAGPSRQQLPGFALCSNPRKSFDQLQSFGSSFLERFEGALMPEEEVPVLGSLSFIDTPGVLSGDKQRMGRSYDFEGVMGWFAEHADLVIVLFDPNKLDISDEFRRCLEALGKNSERKVRFVLNKAEKLDRFELVRVFGGLMWSLSKVISSPEMPYIFVSAAAEQCADLPPEARDFFLSEEAKLRQEVWQVPCDNTTRKVNDLLRRGRLLRCHTLLVNHLLTLQGPFGRRKLLRETLADPVKLAAACAQVAQESNIPLQDFPSAENLTALFRKFGDVKTIKPVPSNLFRAAEEALNTDIPVLLERVASEREEMIQQGIPGADGLLKGKGSGPTTEQVATATEKGGPATHDSKEDLSQAQESQHEEGEKSRQLEDYIRKASALESELEELRNHLVDAQQERPTFWPKGPMDSATGPSVHSMAAAKVQLKLLESAIFKAEQELEASWAKACFSQSPVPYVDEEWGSPWAELVAQTTAKLCGFQEARGRLLARMQELRLDDDKASESDTDPEERPRRSTADALNLCSKRSGPG
eukprot:s305_g21.t3